MNKDLLKKVGKMFVCGFEGLEFSEHARFCSTELLAGNWILFSRNVESITQLTELNKELRLRTLENNGFEPFITIDQEGGIVSRLHGNMNYYPGAMACAAAGLGSTQQTVRIMASHLKQMGINMNLAPVADINSNPRNPIVGPRSYGDNPRQVTEAALTAAKANIDAGIIPVLKHFPGHGDTSTDSHLELPLLNYSLDQLEQRELIPFIRGIEQEMPAIMVAHMNIPALDDSGLPSSLSKKVITGLLRESLGFEGLVLTDCLEMNGIRSHYKTADAVRKSLNAGADMLFISHTPEEQEEGIKAIYDDLVSGKITESRINRSIGRMETYRKKYCGTASQSDDGKSVQVSGFTSWQAEDLSALRETSRKSLTLVKNDAFFSETGLQDDPRLLILHLRRPEQFIGENTVAGGEAVGILKQAFPKAGYRKIKPEEIGKELAEEAVKSENWDRILVLCSDLFLHKEAMSFLKRLLESDTKIAVAVMRTPYEAGEFTDADALILCYEDTIPAYTSLTEFLTGEFKAEGVCPVKIPGL